MVVGIGGGAPEKAGLVVSRGQVVRAAQATERM